MFVFQLFFCFVSWKAICFTYCSLAKPLQFTNLLLHKFNRILWVKPNSTLEHFLTAAPLAVVIYLNTQKINDFSTQHKERDGLRGEILPEMIEWSHLCITDLFQNNPILIQNKFFPKRIYIFFVFMLYNFSVWMYRPFQYKTDYTYQVLWTLLAIFSTYEWSSFTKLRFRQSF